MVLNSQPVAYFAEFDTPYGMLKVSITERLRRKCRKGRIWKSAAMLTALKNAAYGFDAKAPRSRGGSGRNILCRPQLSPGPLVPILATELGSPPKDRVPSRLVSHHMRLLGVISLKPNTAHMALVDYDNEKPA